jgi:plastocyanin
MNDAVMRGSTERDGMSSVLARVERRLGFALAILLLSIVGIAGAHYGQPLYQYVGGSTMVVSAQMEGAGCGSHLEWESPRKEIDAGSRVEFQNNTVYWQIPVVIERMHSDGTYSVIAESPNLRGGESWIHTFWRTGEYRIVSTDENQMRAGLEMVISVK